MTGCPGIIFSFISQPFGRWNLLPELLNHTDADVTVVLAPEMELLVKVVGQGLLPAL